MKRIKKFGKKIRRTFGGSGRDIGERYGDERVPQRPTRLKGFESKSMDVAFEQDSPADRNAAYAGSPVRHLHANPAYDPHNRRQSAEAAVPHHRGARPRFFGNGNSSGGGANGGGESKKSGHGSLRRTASPLEEAHGHAVQLVAETKRRRRRK